MRRPSPLLQRGKETDLDSAMTPMIDVVFLLLVFFVWTASFHIVEQILDSKMSAQMGSDPLENVDPPPEKDFEDVVVRIDWDGQAPSWSINGQPLGSLEALGEQLQTISNLQTNSDPQTNSPKVILDPRPVVPLGYVIEAYDIAKLAGFAEVSFAVNPQRL